MYRASIYNTAMGFVFAIALVLMHDVANADAIDGAWCSPTSERVTIKGENVVTPGGRKIKGAYTRHSMVFRIPAGEEGAGKTLYMHQLHEGAVRMTTISEVQVEPGPHEDWTRCQATVS